MQRHVNGNVNLAVTLGQGKFVFISCAFGGQISPSPFGALAVFGRGWVNGGYFQSESSLPSSIGRPGKLQTAHIISQAISPKQKNLY